jgi:hypothetical protein
MSQEMAAVCGLDRSQCPVLSASLRNGEAAELLADWWRREGWLHEDEGADSEERHRTALERLRRLAG